MAIVIDEIKDKPVIELRSAIIVGFNGSGFKQISTSNIVELNSKGKIPISYIDFSDLVFKGTYNALTNVPILSDSIGTDNDYYIVNVDGSQDLGHGLLTMKSGDRLIYYNDMWNLVPDENTLEYNNDFDI